MVLHWRASLISVVFLSCLTTLVSSASSTQFCKCVCGSNSTIIPLDGTPLDPPASRARLSSSSSAIVSTAQGTGTRPDTLIPPEAKQVSYEPAQSAARKIYDPADQGYEFPRPDADYLQRMRRDVLKRQESADGDPSESGAQSSPPPSAVPEEDEGSAGNSTETQFVTPKRAGTCNDCNRQFCLDHPDFDKMCGEAKEEEVFTSCFQRDSRKDQLVVYTFILVTVGLLAYAAVRPWIEKKHAAFKERRTYTSVPAGQSDG